MHIFYKELKHFASNIYYSLTIYLAYVYWNIKNVFLAIKKPYTIFRNITYVLLSQIQHEAASKVYCS